MKDKKTKDRIVLTGGGTTGHVSVNLALIPKLLEKDYDIYYIGSKNGIEKELIEPIEGVKYVSISTGKLRRYLSWENFKDFFKVIGGTFQATSKIRRIKPDVAFSKGGFVSVPVLIGAWFNKVPSITHESDLTPGLANKLVQPFVKTVFTTFPETEQYIKSGKGKFLGPVIREGLLNGDKSRCLQKLGITYDKPILLVMGGSMGAQAINEMLRANLDTLLERFNIIHACGKGALDSSLDDKEGYYQFEYINEGLNDVFAASDIVISRSGSNAIFEFLYYKIPMLLIPFEIGSRGDQIDNAKSFTKQGFSIMRMETSLDNQGFLQALDEIYEKRDQIKENMASFQFDNTADKIIEELERIKK